jgi:hypothetical protein
MRGVFHRLHEKRWAFNNSCTTTGFKVAVKVNQTTRIRNVRPKVLLAHQKEFDAIWLGNLEATTGR